MYNRRMSRRKRGSSDSECSGRTILQYYDSIGCFCRWHRWQMLEDMQFGDFASKIKSSVSSHPYLHLQRRSVSRNPRALGWIAPLNLSYTASAFPRTSCRERSRSLIFALFAYHQDLGRKEHVDLPVLSIFRYSFSLPLWWINYSPWRRRECNFPWTQDIVGNCSSYSLACLWVFRTS